MNRNQLRQYRPGTAEYIVLHGTWSHARGRAPSAVLPFESNPKKALAWANQLAYFPKNGKYLGGTTPANYVCGECGVTGVKLWREYQTCVDQQSLLCLGCACTEQKKVCTPTEDGKSLYTDEVRHWFRSSTTRPGWWAGYDPADPKKSLPVDAIETKTDRERTDQIGWRVPAVPTEDGESYWGYTSVPQLGCDWWSNLPALAKSQ